jgi:hypothetical protein
MKFILATKKHKMHKNFFCAFCGSHGHPEGWAGVAALAVFEGEVAAEGALAVVTGQTGRVACGGEMFCGGR